MTEVDILVGDLIDTRDRNTGKLEGLVEIPTGSPIRRISITSPVNNRLERLSQGRMDRTSCSFSCHSV
jgi:hypothetical protein